MIEIAAQMLGFKEAIRHNWNTYFAPGHQSMLAAKQDAFASIERALLRVLVLESHGMGAIAEEYRTRVLHEILVRPAHCSGRIPIRYGRGEADGNFTWDQEVLVPVDSTTDFHFYDFFDWYPYGYVDLPLVRVRTTNLQGAGDAKMALLEQHHCRFILNNTNGAS